MRDAWRLATGTFLALPVRPPSHVDASVAGGAMVLAPLTAVPAAALWVLLGVAGVHTSLQPLVGAAVGIAVVALLSRAMHLDGLADTADGLTSGYDREHSLDVMRRGDTGPAGAAAIVLVLLIQFAALAALLQSVAGAALAAVALVSSRLAPAVACRRGVVAARSGGLGSTVAGTVSTTGLGVSIIVVTAAGALASWPTGMSYAAGLVVVAALLGAWLVSNRAVRRLGGITGDTIGAAIEISLAVALVTASVVGSG